ncbi:MFS transporter [Dermatobacter hominis]|uniref:MFS transporter n=1 Tax=Dermatobacter hominis TaxID=2884263 RepID=UPI001D1194FB|nr:MFS transporter [Dermatobacter hominis]UDY34726.1 MFS transporter [Dermatobacter hominis]
MTGPSEASPALPADPPGLWDPSHRWVLVGVTCLITVVAIEAMAVSTVMPVVEDDLGDIWLYGWTFSAFSLGDLIGIVLGGRAADRVRPVVPLLVGVATFTAGLLIGGFAPAMWVLVLGRALQGVGAGVVPAVSYVCVGRGFPPSIHPKVFAVMSTAWIVPSLVSPLLASAVATAFGWRWVFLGLVPIMGVVVCLAVFSLRGIGAPDEPSREAAPIARTVRLAVGAGMVLGGLTMEHPVGIVGLVLVGGIVAVPPLRSLVPPGTFRAARGLPVVVLVRGVLTFAFFSADAFVSLALTSVRGTSTLYAGMVLAAASLTWTAGSWLQARQIAVWGPARLERLGALCLIGGSTLYAVCLLSAVPVPFWFLASAIAGFGMGTAYSPLSVVALERAEAGREGAATSALQLNDILGVALGTGLAGVVVTVGDRLGADRRPTMAVIFLGAAAVAVVVALLAPRLGGPSLRAAPDPAPDPAV